MRKLCKFLVSIQRQRATFSVYVLLLSALFTTPSHLTPPPGPPKKSIRGFYTISQ